MFAERKNSELRFCVLHVELELVSRVRGVQRRGDCARPRYCQEHDHELQAVRQYDGHRSAGLHSRARKQFGDAFNLIAELGVCNLCAARNAYRHVSGALWIQDVGKCTQLSAPYSQYV